MCGATWSLTVLFDDYGGSGVYDMNSQITMTFPVHSCDFDNAPISLFLAAHLDGNGLQTCLQRSDEEGADGIPTDWWVPQ